jgi:hypothetical protein
MRLCHSLQKTTAWSVQGRHPLFPISRRRHSVAPPIRSPPGGQTYIQNECSMVDHERVTSLVDSATPHPTAARPRLRGALRPRWATVYLNILHWPHPWPSSPRRPVKSLIPCYPKPPASQTLIPGQFDKACPAFSNLALLHSRLSRTSSTKPIPRLPISQPFSRDYPAFTNPAPVQPQSSRIGNCP